MTQEKTTKNQADFFSKENLTSLGLLIIAVFAFRWSVASLYHVPTASMEPSIKVGDRLFANKLAYGFKLPFTDIELFSWGTPQRGDIIVFKYPEEPSIDYVKRVVGIGGDHIKIASNILYINGEPQELKSANDQRQILEDIADQKEIKDLYRENLKGLTHWVIYNQDEYKGGPFSADWPRPGDPQGSEYIVPKDAVFCIGDNRDNSKDSRMWGIVTLDKVRGRAAFVFWSEYHNPESGWFNFHFRFDRFGMSLN